MLNKMWKIIFLIFLSSCADDTTTNSTTTINPENLNIMTWNIESFPKTNQTIGYVTQIINSLDVDIIALQEIEDTASLSQLANSLDGNWAYYRSSDGNYKELSYIPINQETCDIIILNMNKLVNKIL